MQGQFNPWMFLQPQMMGNNFQNQPMNFGGNANWAGSYTGIMDPNQAQNTNNQFNQFQNQDNKMNFIFKTSSGSKPINILFNYGKTVEDLIHTFFKRVDREELFQTGGVAFIHNAKQIDYHNNTKIERFFQQNMIPTIMVLDVNNLIGA